MGYGYSLDLRQRVAAFVEAGHSRRASARQRIALEVSLSPATVSRILRRLGLNRIRDLGPAEPARRYERDHPGDMIHLDIKKLGLFSQVGHRITGDRKGQSNGRGIGWEFVHVSIDDASRLAFSQVMPDEKAASAVAFLEAAVAYYQSLGITVHDRQRLLHSQGLPRRLRRSRREACANQALHAQNQRQGRALHPDGPARMGLCKSLSDVAVSRRRPTQMDPRLQLASPARRHPIRRAHQQTPSRLGQPVEAPHLGACPSNGFSERFEDSA